MANATANGCSNNEIRNSRIPASVMANADTAHKTSSRPKRRLCKRQWADRGDAIINMNKAPITATEVKKKVDDEAKIHCHGPINQIISNRTPPPLGSAVACWLQDVAAPDDRIAAADPFCTPKT